MMENLISKFLPIFHLRFNVTGSGNGWFEYNGEGERIARAINLREASVHRTEF